MERIEELELLLKSESESLSSRWDWARGGERRGGRSHRGCKLRSRENCQCRGKWGRLFGVEGRTSQFECRGGANRRFKSKGVCFMRVLSGRRIVRQ